MNTRLKVTVMTAEGRPTINLPGKLNAAEVRTIVRTFFGMQTTAGHHAIPHSFCGVLEPAPAVSEEGQHGSPYVLLSQRGHLRAI